MDKIWGQSRLLLNNNKRLRLLGLCIPAIFFVLRGIYSRYLFDKELYNIYNYFVDITYNNIYNIFL